MAYGLNLIGTGSSHVISSEWHISKFKGKGSNISRVSVDVNHAPYYETSYYMECQSPTLSSTTCPTPFFHIPSGSMFSLARLYSYDSTHWRICFFSKSSSYPTIYWFEEVVNSASSDTYGMRLYDGDSDLIFDSGWAASNILRIKSIHSVVASPSNSFTVPSGVSKPAIMFYSPYCDLLAPNAYDNFIYDLGVANSSNVMTLSKVCVQYHRYAYGGYAAHTYSDGATRYVPVIDGADYD